MPPAESCRLSREPRRNARFERLALSPHLALSPRLELERPGHMTVSLESIPRFTAPEALAAAARHYGIQGSASALPSERDQNFLVADAAGGKYVVKIANAGDAPELLEFQIQAMRRVQRLTPDWRVQRVLGSLQGSDITKIHDPRTDTGHCLRVLTWMDGEVLAHSRPRGSILLQSIGANMAKVDAALRDFSHPAMHRSLQWDLRRAGMARDNAALLPHDRRTRVQRHFSQWERIDWTALRHSVIHGDANDHNVIVADGRMVGLLDFGDMVYTATVCDLAVALAYAMLGEREPMAAAAQVIRAYQGQYPLTEPEQRVLFPLVMSRLTMSVCYSAHNRARNPDDLYQVVSEAAAWDLLDKLELWSAGDAFELIHAACASPAAP